MGYFVSFATSIFMATRINLPPASKPATIFCCGSASTPESYSRRGMGLAKWQVFPVPVPFTIAIEISATTDSGPENIVARSTVEALRIKPANLPIIYL
jgi:hypothetical protein